MRKFSDEGDIDSWYDEQKKMLLEKMEAELSAKNAKASENFSAAMKQVHLEFETQKKIFIEQGIAASKASDIEKLKAFGVKK